MVRVQGPGPGFRSSLFQWIFVLITVKRKFFHVSIVKRKIFYSH